MSCRIALVCGGVSTEHEISLLSCYNIYQGLKDLYPCSVIYITKKGEWKRLSSTVFEQWYKNPEALSASWELIHLTLDPASHGFACDVVFPVLHGKNGEDGTIQGVCELLGIPYVWCGVLSSALCMDKHLTKVVLQHHGIPIVPYVIVRKNEEVWTDLKTILSSRWRPVFVKPSRSGSSVGVSKCTTREEVENAVSIAFQYDTKVLIEKGVVGYEPECAVLWNEIQDELIVGEVGRIINHRDFYSYEAKYFNDTDSTTEIPASIPDDLKVRIQEYSKKAFRALECQGLARVDFLVSEESELFLNEVNTMPGFTNISMYPKMLEAAGISFKDVLISLITVAFQKNKLCMKNHEL